MSPKRGDEVAPPPIGTEWKVRYANSESVTGWRELCGVAPGNLRQAYESMRSDPRPVPTGRRHRLRDELSSVVRNGTPMEHWQIEITGGGRVWYHIDDSAHTVWIDYAGAGHPKKTDR